MTTENLILRLAANSRAAPPVRWTLAAWLVPAVVVTFALMVLGWGLRPDLLRAIAEPMVLLKMGLPILASGAAIAGALCLARPEERMGGKAVVLVLIGLVALGLCVLGMVETPRDGWGAALWGSTLVHCLLSIPTLAILPTLALLAGLRRGASLAPALSGALAGLGGGAAAAAIYAFHCTEDHPLFFVTWYGTGILLAMSAGALAGRRWLRW